MKKKVTIIDVIKLLIVLAIVSNSFSYVAEIVKGISGSSPAGFLKLLFINLFKIDITVSVAAIVNFIPFGSIFFIPRLPLLLTLIVMAVQRTYSKNRYFCSNCKRSLTLDELNVQCSSCNKDSKMNYMKLKGSLYSKCSCKECNNSTILSFRGEMIDRTRIYNLDLRSKGFMNNRKVTVKCSYCGTHITNNEKMNSYTVYAEDVVKANEYRIAFLYNSFCGGKKAPFGVLPDNKEEYDKINDAYAGGLSRCSFSPFSFKLQTKSASVNNTSFVVHAAANLSEKNPLLYSDGIICVLDGSKTAIEIRTEFDNFIINLERLMLTEKTWKKPILIGLCANGADDLEKFIDSAPKSENEIEKKCLNYLKEQGNTDIINTINDKADNVHFFIYRTGFNFSKNHDKNYNTVHPGKALMVNSCSKLSGEWRNEPNGQCPKVKG